MTGRQRYRTDSWTATRLPQNELAVKFSTMKFSTMTVSVEPAANGVINVVISYSLDNPPNEASQQPEVMSLETVAFPDGTNNIDRVNGLLVSAAEVAEWLTTRGQGWRDWNPRAYLKYRMDAGLSGGW